MCESSKFHGRRTFFKGMAAAAAVASTQLPSLANSAPAGGGAKYADPAKPALPKTDMKLDLTRTAFVVIDPQIDFMSPKGKAWPVVGESVTEQNMVPNLVRLFQASKKAGITIAISPHYYYPQDHRWQFQGGAEIFQHNLGLFDRPSALSLEGFRGSGSDFLPEFKPYIEDDKTIICSPHKLYGPQVNDLKLQLGKQRVEQVILAGMLANLCVESHLRDLLENGFEVAVVRDAVAGPKLPEGDGYGAALVNYRFIADGVWTTDDTVKMLEGKSV
ncbi:cysteine hydrolase [Burkholderia stagnalis]|uniref:Cysteine hydrolase n=1 Tax=Burkholderia stagnalis TaxID=1503054 RepID=A0A6L3MYC5_9BURK|nr:cysteine hydrolase [Burkholderia stagnalis]RQQ07226.1 cysteine hydrolase [Burkholderia stagnalis]RQQ16146.1 cysteine hydrolase [Burkholderia stagnalis]RQQ21960.1 cysteine hydrolase [Burkholderia stagnalis]RQQ23810.1 cysteine hydrolase [Burkholderia stagnalis]